MNKTSPVSIKNAPVHYPKISLITPALNQGQFIERTIQSVLSQNYPNLEYIIMDGGSSDNTLDLLERYSNQLKWVSENDNGQTQAINKGLAIASGEVLAYLNADDLLLPGALLRVAQVFMEYPEAMWVTGQCRIVDEKNNEIRRLITNYKNMLLHIRSFALLLMTNYISQPATFWRREALVLVGGLDENLRYVMDYEYWLRMYSKYPPAFIPEYLAAFRIHQSSKTTSTGHKDTYIQEEVEILNRYAPSSWHIGAHHIHRALMTFAYSIMNRPS